MDIDLSYLYFLLGLICVIDITLDSLGRYIVIVLVVFNKNLSDEKVKSLTKMFEHKIRLPKLS